MGRLSAALLLPFLLAGCTMGPIWSPRLEGRVVDHYTGEPVAGAVVTSVYRLSLMMTHGNSSPLEAGSTRTGADGYFTVPGRFAFTFLPMAVTPRNPGVRAFHPQYGSGAAHLPRGDDAWDLDRFHVEIRLQESDYELDELLAPEHPAEICNGHSTRSCELLCQAAYADVDYCLD